MTSLHAFITPWIIVASCFCSEMPLIIFALGLVLAVFIILCCDSVAGSVFFFDVFASYILQIVLSHLLLCQCVRAPRDGCSHLLCTCRNVSSQLLAAHGCDICLLELMPHALTEEACPKMWPSCPGPTSGRPLPLTFRGLSAGRLAYGL